MKHYTVFNLGNDEWGVMRVYNDTVDTMYAENTRGKIQLLQFNSYRPSDHSLARFSHEDAMAYATFKNEEQKRAD